MTTHQTLTGYLLVGALSIGLVAYSIQASASQEGQPQQREQQVPVTAFLAEQEKANALAKELVQVRIQLAQAPYNCISTAERANPGKTLNPQTFVIEDKPVAPVATPKK